MLPFKLVYHDDFDLRLGDHVFPSLKYKLIRETLESQNFATSEDFVTPEPALDEDLLLVHTAAWIHSLKSGKLTAEEIQKLEMPFSPELVNAFWLMAGGSITAARLALRDRFAYCVGGGFHHAFPGHGEGFCAINDVAVAVRKLQKDGSIHRAMVVDCDVHHGNGTADIFAGDFSVFTLSIHQLNNYPSIKPPSDVDIHLPDGVGDQEYLDRLGPVLVKSIYDFGPDLLIYVAGADPYEQDQLGGLRLTVDGLRRRDKLVIESAKRGHVPVAVTLAGGYALRVEDTVRIHCNTAKVAAELYGR